MIFSQNWSVMVGASGTWMRRPGEPHWYHHHHLWYHHQHHHYWYWSYILSDCLTKTTWGRILLYENWRQKYIRFSFCLLYKLLTFLFPVASYLLPHFPNRCLDTQNIQFLISKEISKRRHFAECAKLLRFNCKNN